MTEEVQGQEVQEVQEKVVTPEQAYLQGVLEKFNANPNDPTLQHAERILLGKIRSTHQGIAELTKQVEAMNDEINDRQKRGNELVQKLIHLQGQSQGYVDSLLALR